MTVELAAASQNHLGAGRSSSRRSRLRTFWDPHRFLAPGETTVAVEQPPGRALLGIWRAEIAGFFTAMGLLGAAPAGLPLLRVAGASLLAISAVAAAIRLVRWSHVCHLLTSRRVLTVRGSLQRCCRTIPLGAVRAVWTRQSRLQRILGYGTVIIAVSGSATGRRELASVGRPRKFAHLLAERTAATVGIVSNVDGAE